MSSRVCVTIAMCKEFDPFLVQKLSCSTIVTSEICLHISTQLVVINLFSMLSCSLQDLSKELSYLYSFGISSLHITCHINILLVTILLCIVLATIIITFCYNLVNNTFLKVSLVELFRMKYCQLRLVVYTHKISSSIFVLMYVRNMSFISFFS